MSGHHNIEEEAPASSLSRYVLSPIIWLGGALSTATILALFVVTIYAIGMRYLFNAPSLWTDEVTGWGLVTLVMFGAAEAYRRGDHIAVDLLSTHATGLWRKLFHYISDLAVLLFGIVLGVSAWEAISFVKAFGSYTNGNVEVETWILQVPLLLGSALLSMTAILKIAERAMGFRK